MISAGASNACVSPVFSHESRIKTLPARRHLRHSAMNAPDDVSSLSSSLNRLSVTHDGFSASSPNNNVSKSPGRVSIPNTLAVPPSSSNVGEEAEHTPATSASVASQFFKNELLSHETPDSVRTNTVVLIHDACYGHRWSRPNPSKAALGSIVERPERLQAAMRGVAAAYVRLGERHSGGEHAPHPKRRSSGEVPFRIRKSSRLMPLTSPAVVNVHGSRWMTELQAMCENAEAKLAAGQKELGRSKEAGQAAKTELHDGDLYLCRDSLDALQGALGGVIDGVDAVFTDHKKAFVCIRPPGHHCSADLPSGFCWINNVHVGIEHAALNHGLTHAVIIDFDLHHGDGSQKIAWERNAKSAKATKKSVPADKTSVGYFSLHDINSYPCEYGDVENIRNASICIENAHAQMVWNIHLKPWASKPEFWKLYDERYVVLLDKARHYLRAQTEHIKSTSPGIKPKAAIFISAGFDASEWESEGMQRHKVNVPTEFYARFTKDMVTLANEEGTGVEGRIVSVLEGGYSGRALTSGILSHLVGLTSNSLDKKRPTDKLDEAAFNSHWWSSQSLTELESTLHPSSDLPTREPRSAEPHAFWSPTRSFSAKVVDPSKLYRSISGTIAPTRLPTPPPPEVDWTVATHELGKLLIPSDRQVNSCKFEELTEMKAKRERTSGVIGPPPPPLQANGDRMQLRGRKSGVGIVGTSVPPAKSVAGDISARQSTPAILDGVPGINIRKSRRISGALPDLTKHEAAAPTSVESLTAGVKKITLRYNGPKEAEPAASKPVKKLTVPKPLRLTPAVKPLIAKSSRGMDNAATAIRVVVPHPDMSASTPTATPAAFVGQANSPPTEAKDDVVPTHLASHDRLSQLTIAEPNPQKHLPATVGRVPDANGNVPPTGRIIALPPDASNTPDPLRTADATLTSASSDVPTTSTIPVAPSCLKLNSTPEAVFPTPPHAPQSKSPLPATREILLQPQAPSVAHPALAENQFIPYIPEGHVQNTVSLQVSQHNMTAPKLTWLPPNTSTPVQSQAPKRVAAAGGGGGGGGGGDPSRLPVFTSDGHIPLAGAGKKI